MSTTEEAAKAAVEHAAIVAHVAASNIYRAYDDPAREGTQTTWWYADGTAEPATPAYDDIAMAELLADFQQGKEPNGETLYRQARYLAAHDMPSGDYAVLPKRVRLAYAIFARVADAAFAEFAADAAREAEAAGAQLVSADASTQEKIGDAEDSLGARDAQRLAASQVAPAKPRKPRTPKKQAAAEAAAADARLKTAVLIVEHALGTPLHEGDKTALAAKLAAEPELDLHALEILENARAAIVPASPAAPPPANEAPPATEYRDPADYAVVIEPLSAEDGGGFLATVPDLPGCTSDGPTIEEATANVRAAIVTWIEAARARLETGEDAV